MSAAIGPRRLGTAALLCCVLGGDLAVAEAASPGVGPRPGPPGAEAGEVHLTGTVLGRGATCLRFATDGGETVSLAGVPATLRPGDRLELVGRWRARSNCMQGRTFRVREILGR
ncbi:hypothetical protein JQC91_10125 [Jannaschia sp. Os4]|uniref:hypothetical protein n=1 Tax=Jannaschia sp. Os4 TaxID=2807617 RepID=UPI00193A706F|nr:hypothetical protein [Jannaschia sp. Os4]MBM2576660.1 hypothetical protein [Jannaschia sp. Os4]